MSLANRGHRSSNSWFSLSDMQVRLDIGIFPKIAGPDIKTTIITIAFRELITIPHGGVAALPPSFLVNQLQDLMARWMTVLLLLMRMMVVMIKITSVLANQLQDLVAKLAVAKVNKIILTFPRKGRESSPRCGDHPNQVRFA